MHRLATEQRKTDAMRVFAISWSKAINSKLCWKNRSKSVWTLKSHARSTFEATQCQAEQTHLLHLPSAGSYVGLWCDFISILISFIFFFRSIFWWLIGNATGVRPWILRSAQLQSLIWRHNQLIKHTNANTTGDFWAAPDVKSRAASWSAYQKACKHRRGVTDLLKEPLRIPSAPELVFKDMVAPGDNSKKVELRIDMIFNADDL